MIRAGGTDADAVVIGAGFFGCHVALQLRGIGMDRVILEADPERIRNGCLNHSNEVGLRRVNLRSALF
jgi:2-polyprenyl-6-methoxyphenol hydroxylase-like FAD-dependent oxidoreductase